MRIKRAIDDLTIDMFSYPHPVAALPASMNYGQEVAHLVSIMLAAAELDRYQVAAEMSKLTGKEVSKYMLDAYSAESREAFNIPFYLIPSLETVSQSHMLTNWLADKRGGRLLIGKENLNAELGKLERQRDDAARKIKELKKVLGEEE